MLLPLLLELELPLELGVVVDVLELDSGTAVRLVTRDCKKTFKNLNSMDRDLN